MSSVVDVVSSHVHERISTRAVLVAVCRDPRRVGEMLAETVSGMTNSP
jgi:hypothetical protein